MSQRPLSGVRVIDLTFVVAGPVGTSVLGSLGAEVIKIENTVARVNNQPYSEPPPRQTNFLDLNRNKLGITLNLSTPAGKDIFRRLVAISDVVIDNFSPRVMRNFSFEYADLAKINPGIIVASMPAFGNTGPMRDRGSFGPGIDAMSGLSHLTGYPDSTPLKPGNYYCDFNAGVHAALAVMAAVYHKRRTGRGQAIEVAMRDGETQLIGEYILEYVLNRTVQERAANYHPTMAPHNVYRCLGDDKWLAIAVASDAEWASLCHVMGRPELATDPRFATALARKRHEAALDENVAAWTRGRGHIAAMHALQAANVAAAAVMTTEEIASDPQFQHRGTFQLVQKPGTEDLRLGRVAWLARRAQSVLERAPEYGEHTVQVLRDLLHLSDDEISDLAAAGAIWLPMAEAAKESS
jgi:crotonobetainyl-CoA:carnitine CoA-transferase CaiB-like acyl-CoA transferase